MGGHSLTEMHLIPTAFYTWKLRSTVSVQIYVGLFGARGKTTKFPVVVKEEDTMESVGRTVNEKR